MFINPKHAIDHGWITFPSWMTEEQRKKCIQPNAIDFTLDHLYMVSSDAYACVTETEKVMRGVVPVTVDSDNNWVLQRNTLYDGTSDFYVNVPDNVAAMLVIRSTFNRNGILLTSGLYDGGFQGHIGYALFNRSGDLTTSPGTRIGQIVFIDAPSSARYAGGYNHAPGSHWTGTPQH